jgi:hypothetical protein
MLRPPTLGGDAGYIARSGPFDIGLNGTHQYVALCLRPMQVFDPPVLLALCDLPSLAASIPHETKHLNGRGNADR